MIECKNITKVYQAGGVQAAKVLKGVSFSVESGEFVAISVLRVRESPR
jgi:ABC-type lipoprotein export system ATPase subunit